MLEFFEKNLGFLIVVTIVASFVIWEVRKDRKREEKKQNNNAQKKNQENKKEEEIK